MLRAEYRPTLGRLCCEASNIRRQVSTIAGSNRGLKTLAWLVLCVMIGTTAQADEEDVLRATLSNGLQVIIVIIRNGCNNGNGA